MLCTANMVTRVVLVCCKVSGKGTVYLFTYSPWFTLTAHVTVINNRLTLLSKSSYCFQILGCLDRNALTPSFLLSYHHHSYLFSALQG